MIPIGKKIHVFEWKFLYEGVEKGCKFAKEKEFLLLDALDFLDALDILDFLEDRFQLIINSNSN